MAVTDKAWDGSSSNYEDADAYCSACLIDSNPSGADKKVDLCKLPVKEPNGDINRNAVHNAAARFNQLSGVSEEEKRSAARKLLSIYRNDLHEEPPQVLKSAGGTTSKEMSANIRRAAGR